VTLRKKTHTTLLILGFLFPSMVIIGGVMVYPILYAIIMSLSRVKLGTWEFTFVGFSHFSKLFTDSAFWGATQNSLIWVVGCTAIQFFLGFVAALLLSKRVPYVSVFRTILLFPWAVSGVVVAFNWFWLLHGDFGMVSWTLKQITNVRVGLLENVRTVFPALMLIHIWWQYPFAMLVLLAGLQSVPLSFREAAIIDGANSIQVLWHIIIPWIRPIIITMLILQIIEGLNAFTIVQIVTGGGPAGITEIFAVFIYKRAFTLFRFEEAAAASIIVLAITLPLSFLYIITFMEKRRS